MKMTPTEMAELAIYRTSRLGGYTKDEGHKMVKLYPVKHPDPTFSIAGFDDMTQDEAFAAVDSYIQSSPYYNAGVDRLNPPPDVIRQFH